MNSSRLVVAHFERQQLPSGGTRITVSCDAGWPKDSKIRFSDDLDWRALPTGSGSVAVDFPPKLYLQPCSNWIAHLSLTDGDRPVAAVFVMPRDRPGLLTPITQLANYAAYYSLRQRDAVTPLWSVDNKSVSSLVLPIVESINAPELKTARTVFVLGDDARQAVSQRWALLDQSLNSIASASSADQQWVTVFPQKTAESALWSDFLSRADAQFPYFGALPVKPWFTKNGLAGHLFEENLPSTLPVR